MPLGWWYYGYGSGLRWLLWFKVLYGIKLWIWLLIMFSADGKSFGWKLGRGYRRGRMA